jgi:serine/threonine-protein kinase
MAADPLVGKVLADRFAILEKIGEGGMGVVYKAKQLSVDRIIAIKVLGAHVSTDPSWVKRFHNEARAASRLDHPNTVRLIDFGQTSEGLLFIAMELLHGKSLRDIIDREGMLPPVRALKIISQACQSLQEAHTQGIIHRDIKPDNIHLEQKSGHDFVKVLDFSVAKLDAPDAMQTRAGVVFGTPSYMSPEQGRGVPLDRRSDVYALGIVLYEMLNGHPPFEGKIPTEVVMAHLRDKPKPLSGVPPELNALVMKTLEKEPAKRQQSAEELDQECQQMIMQLGGHMTPMSGVPMMGGPSRPVAQAPVTEAKTQFQQAPVLPGRGAAGGGPPPMAAPAGGASEMKTQFQSAPILPSSAPPTSAPPPLIGPPGGGTEAKTMMAQAPILPPRPAVSQESEMKTMMAQAPILPGKAPPGSGKTMLATEAPRPTPAAAPPGSNARTVAAMPAPTPQPAQPNPQATMMMGDSQGVVAYAQERAAQVRAGLQEAPKPAGALFWMAWVILGVGAGLGLHFFLLRGM